MPRRVLIQRKVGSSGALAGGGAGAGAGDVIDVTGNGQDGETGPAVAVHDAAGNEMAFRPVANGLPGEVGNAADAMRLAVGRNLTAARNGVLPEAPRPVAPSERAPPTRASPTWTPPMSMSLICRLARWASIKTKH